ncbi:transcriptional regulator BetI [Corynebacterium kalinowskii]|uniref:Transcriptional regulator BetI n=1 Tax=Corynebacterium kalinowskii TaxID=2675216 RepID=A0A6B8V9X3_9CORY|nr:TetR/AcrR family transcriptional regulator [Corynebacterium kalinowskii]QGU01153.1 transcriptional regulator BetI [Corynebacterium kalinowskii]
MRILLAVWGVIATRGIAGVSIRVVAQEAGISAGRVQYYFPTKDALLVESCRGMTQLAEQEYEAMEGDPETKLFEAIAHVIPRDEQSRRGAIIWNNYVAESLVRPEIATILAEAKRGQEEEVARRLEPGNETKAREMIALADGLVQRVLIGDLSAAEADHCIRAALEAYP